MFFRTPPAFVFSQDETCESTEIEEGRPVEGDDIRVAHARKSEVELEVKINPSGEAEVMMTEEDEDLDTGEIFLLEPRIAKAAAMSVMEIEAKGEEDEEEDEEDFSFEEDYEEEDEEEETEEYDLVDEGEEQGEGSNEEEGESTEPKMCGGFPVRNYQPDHHAKVWLKISFGTHRSLVFSRRPLVDHRDLFDWKISRSQVVLSVHGCSSLFSS